MNRSEPECIYCKGSGPGFEFPLWPKCVDMSFGDICVGCDDGRSDPDAVDSYIGRISSDI